MLPELLDEVAKQVEPMVRTKKLAFGVSVRETCPPMETDKTKVKQILLNLLSNAIKFTNDGSVRVEVTCPRDGVRIDVIDTGVGIKLEDIEIIWEDFRQLDQSRTRSYGGTGLGLSITKRLTRQLGGQIEVTSVVGKGTTFSVTLPVRLSAAALPTATGHGLA